MNKPYCGVRKVPKNRKLGTFLECMDRGQVRYYGIKHTSFQINAALEAKKKIANLKAKKKRQEAKKKVAEANKAVREYNKADSEANKTNNDAEKFIDLITKVTSNKTKGTSNNTTGRRRGRPSKVDLQVLKDAIAQVKNM